MTVRQPTDPINRLLARRGEARRALLDWFAGAARDLPFRRRRDPYAVWIAEVMLQQTTVAAATPYWEAFMARFPDAGALAAASEEEVLRLWSGLGYYRRARNLLAAARLVAAERGGELPGDVAGLRALPGVGAYTAAAVASQAFGVPAPALDGNALRVYARLAAVEGDGRTGSAARAVEAAAEGLIDPDAPGDWNQAVMELGATVCVPRAPRCGACPLATLCAGRGAGSPATFGTARARPETTAVLRAAAIVRDRRGRFLLRRIGPEERNGGLWEPPTVELARGAGAGDSTWNGPLAARLADALAARCGLDAVIGASLGRTRHSVTTDRIVVHAAAAELRGPAPRGAGWRWLADERPDGEALSGEARKLLAIARRAGPAAG
ncbi:MAG: A/G-specific adenine glycosylase [Candidatus Polarisedimenticolia bacterium]|nr:A/G-specific adenine glycosylase [bacterium]